MGFDFQPPGLHIRIHHIKALLEPKSKNAIELKKEYGLCLGQGTMQPDPSCQNCSSTQGQQNQFSFQNDKSSFCHIRIASHKSNTYSRMRASRNMQVSLHYRFLISRKLIFQLNNCFQCLDFNFCFLTHFESRCQECLFYFVSWFKFEIPGTDISTLLSPL